MLKSPQSYFYYSLAQIHLLREGKVTLESIEFSKYRLLTEFLNNFKLSLGDEKNYSPV